MFRHQVAKELALRYLQMKTYMDHHLRMLNLNLKEYVHDVFSGAIWLDEPMLCVIGLMFKVSISIVTPSYTAVKNLLHNNATPDIVLIVNGETFHGKNTINRVVPTRKNAATTTLVGCGLRFGEILRWTGRQNGQIAAKVAINNRCKDLVLTEAELALKNCEMAKCYFQNTLDRTEKVIQQLDNMKMLTDQIKKIQKV